MKGRRSGYETSFPFLSNCGSGTLHLAGPKMSFMTFQNLLDMAVLSQACICRAFVDPEPIVESEVGQKGFRENIFLRTGENGEVFWRV